MPPSFTWLSRFILPFIILQAGVYSGVLSLAVWWAGRFLLFATANWFIKSIFLLEAFPPIFLGLFFAHPLMRYAGMLLMGHVRAARAAWVDSMFRVWILTLFYFGMTGRWRVSCFPASPGHYCVFIERLKLIMLLQNA